MKPAGRIRGLFPILGSPLELQFRQVVIAGFGVVQGFGVIVFYEVVLDTSFAGLGEDLFKVDGTAAYVGYVAGHGVAYGTFVVAGSGAFFAPILHVNQRKAAGELLEIG